MAQNFSAKISFSDYLSLIAFITSAAITIFTLKIDIENKAYIYIFAIITQFLVIVAWLVVFTNIIRANLSINKKANDINLLKKQIEICSEEKKMVEKQLNIIATSIKSNNIHNNEALIKIAQEGDEQYRFISSVQEISDNGKHHPDKVDEELKIHVEMYKTELFHIFNRYCRDTLDEIIKLHKACLLIRNIDTKISVTIKLFDKPFCPEDDNSEIVKIYTSFRDNVTYSSREREIGEKIYSIGKNSDFLQCLHEDYFLINNIKNEKGNYINEDQAFLQYYNCTVVVPIRLKRTDDKRIYFGYLCCDCLNTDEKQSIFNDINANYLFATAQNIATFLETLNSNWNFRLEGKSKQEHHILEILYNKIYKHINH